jgi:Uma2 family endonuclease
MPSQTPQHYTPEEYLAQERQAQCKSEYYASEIFAMAGASRWHNLIVANVISELRSQLKGRSCTTYPSDMRVKVSPAGLYTYPDVIVVCGEALFEDNQQDTLLNPTLMEYVLITQTKPHIEHYVRQPDNRWLLAEADSVHDTVHLPSIDCHLALAEVYDKVDIVGE